jgi:predicted XRE-type DNA-binding protein
VKPETFSSVWEAIELQAPEAANLKARAEVMIAIQRAVRSWKSTQAVSAKRLGLTQPRLNDLLRGPIDKFSLGALTSIAGNAGLSVKIRIVKTAA